MNQLLRFKALINCELLKMNMMELYSLYNRICFIDTLFVQYLLFNAHFFVLQKNIFRIT